MAKQRGRGGSGAQKKTKGGKKSSSSVPAASSNNSNNAGKNNRDNNATKKNKRQQRKTNGKYRRPSSENNHDDAVDANFRSSLLSQGNSIQEMDADGNCLFRSLSDQLHRDGGAKHDVIRHDVCEHLERNKEEFMHFLLMDDDDEDVLGIDEYIEKMREDGEWGGNVEIVVASRVYKRNIKVFSSEYSNGVLSVLCDDEENAEEDLFLSYHGNDHYNSVRRPAAIDNGRKQRSGMKSTNNGKTADNKNQTGMKNTAADEKKKADHDNKHPMKLRIDTAAAGGRNRSKITRPQYPTRGSDCPCNSGLKYKKCCMARDKSRKRLARHLEENDGGGGTATNDDTADEKKEEEFIGEFKVLTI